MLYDYIAGRIAGLHITSRARILIILGIFLIITSIFAPHDTGTKALTLGAILLAFTAGYASLFTLKTAALERLTVERQVDKPLIEGREARIRVRIRNNTPVPLEKTIIIDQPPPIWSFQKPAALAKIPPLGETIIEYKAVPVLGKHVFGPVTIAYRDPLGLIFYKKSIEARTRVIVQPRSLDTPSRSRYLTISQQPSGLARSRMRGIGTEFLELREYKPGDDIRIIDWKSSARSGKLMVKVFESEVVNYILIVADLTESMFTGEIGETKAEYTIRIIASLARYLAKRGDIYKIVLQTPNVALRETPWLRGRNSVYHVLRFLAEGTAWNVRFSKVGEDLGWLEDVGETGTVRPAYESIKGRIPRSRTLVLYFSDFNEDTFIARRAAEALGRIKRLGHEVVAIMPLTVSFEARRLGELAGLYRLLNLDLIRSYGEIRSLFHRRGVPTIVAGPGDILSILLYRIESVIA